MKIEKEHYDKINAAMRVLNLTLREQCVDTGLITIAQWNDEIAPKLSSLIMAIDGVNVTARTYKLSEDYHD